VLSADFEAQIHTGETFPKASDDAAGGQAPDRCWAEKQEAWDGGPVQIAITDGMRQRLFVG
jgi:hypothetical protein